MAEKIIVPRSDLVIKRTYAVEVPLINLAQGQTNLFPRNDVLNPTGDAGGSVIFTGVEAYTADFLSKAESGNDVVSSADALKLSVNLNFANNDFIYYYPYLGFISFANYGMIRRLDRVQIDLTKSTIVIMEAGIAAGKSVVLNFHYLLPEAPKKK